MRTTTPTHAARRRRTVPAFAGARRWSIALIGTALLGGVFLAFGGSRLLVSQPAGDRAVKEVTADREQASAVTLGFAGDVHFQRHLVTLLDHPYGALGPIERALREPDLTMVNLETAITRRETRDAKELEDPDKRYWFRAPPPALDLLASAGVDVATMANNHGADYGPQGVADSLRAAQHGPIHVVGIGQDRSAAFTPHRVTVRGTDIAVFGADASMREGASSVWEAGTDTAGIAAARATKTSALLAAVRRAAALGEVVVVYLHWGRAGQACPSRAQVGLAHSIADAGADVIVGSHAHVQQGAGWLGDTYVAYGLGNFLWYHDHKPNTGVLQLQVKDGRVVSDDWVPAEIQPSGKPRPLSGPARSQAVATWSELRECAGLASQPAGAESAHHSEESREATGELPDYTAAVRPIGRDLRERMASTHGAACPLPWSRLRLLRLSYVGFDGARHVGELVVAAQHARDIVDVFKRLYRERWPIRKMRPVSAFDGDDERSMAADNTSAYNCRRVAGSDSWSAHAFGAAIDINPVENPYLVDGSVRPAVGHAFAYLDRATGASVQAGVIRSDGPVVEAFAAVGWQWGGDWSVPDYQHFVAPSPRDRSFSG